MELEQKRTWLTGAQMKWMAIVVMAIDHAAAVFVEPSPIYNILRGIGRFAFPVFCFLLVEGFFHTRSKETYLRNLVFSAFLSEIPFDLALDGKVWSAEHQNVFFTLAIGLAGITIAEHFMTKAMLDMTKAFLYRVLATVSIVGFAVGAEILHTDYGAMGVITIFILYAMHHKPVMSAVTAWVVLSLTTYMEVYCFPFIGAVYFYNGERGKQNKYFFYLFYPVHLLLLAIIKMIIF